MGITPRIIVTMVKRTGPRNPVLQDLVKGLKEKSVSSKVKLWDSIASDLLRPSRQRRIVNLSKLSRMTKENEVVIVPGKVLGSGELDHKLTISAFQFSEGAKSKITAAGGNIVPLRDMMQEDPKGKKIRVMG